VKLDETTTTDPLTRQCAAALAATRARFIEARSDVMGWTPAPCPPKEIYS